MDCLICGASTSKIYFNSRIVIWYCSICDKKFRLEVFETWNASKSMEIVRNENRNFILSPKDIDKRSAAILLDSDLETLLHQVRK